jgi:hypothetical protein
MAMNESIKMVVVIVLSIAILISGTVLLWKISEMKSVIENIPIPGKSSDIRVEVIPQSSQTGTLFFIKANYFEDREQQDILVNIEKGNYTDPVYLFDDGNHFDGDAKDGVYGGYFDSSGKPLGKYDIKSGDIQEPLTSFTVSEPGCEIIEGGYDGKQISFVILPQGYEDYDEFKRDAKDIISGRNSLLQIEPFKSNKDSFAFFIVNSTRDLQCEIGCKNVSTLICCNNQLVVEEASRCDYDSILVLVNSEKECGSASYYAKLCSKNPNVNLVLAHEAGHSFADLADEYVYADYFGDYAIGEVDEINCAQEGCSKWQNISSGCYEGCTYSNLYRPAEKNSIMYDLYPEFNDVCKGHIQELINKYKEDKNKESPVPEQSYFVNLNYNEGDISIKNIFLKPIRSWQDFRESEYSVQIKNAEGQIFNSSLYLPNKLFPIPPEGSIAYENEVDFSVNLPYFEDAGELEIYKEERPVASSKIELFSDKCGNGLCEGFENHIDCPADCGAEDGFCGTSACDTDCYSQQNCRRNEKIILGAFIMFSVSILVLASFIARRMVYKKYGFYED